MTEMNPDVTKVSSVCLFKSQQFTVLIKVNDLSVLIFEKGGYFVRNPFTIFRVISVAVV